MARIRLLIVDDSAIMRRVIQQVAASDPEIEVVGLARNGQEGVERAAELRPDVITMDVEMPVLNGLEALTQIMASTPTRVLMVSSLTTAGADTTLDALDRGAVEVLAKPIGAAGAVQISALQSALLPRIRAAAAANLDALAPVTRGRTAAPAPTRVRPAAAPSSVADRVVLIGTSTGGPHALHNVIPALPADLPAAVLIVQHMPPLFTAQLARRLDTQSQLSVKEAEEGDEIRTGHVLLAPGGKHLVLRDRHHVGLDLEPASTDHRPSVDVMLESAAGYLGTDAVVVMLTGMGRDGCRGTAALKERGACVIAQDEATSVVFGMPGAVVAAGLADHVCPIGLVPAMIQKALRR